MTKTCPRHTCATKTRSPICGAGLEGRYFEDVLEALVCKSSHKTLVELVPEKTEGDSEEAAELAAKLAQMDEVDKQEIRDEMAALRVMQESPDAPEAVGTLPRLRVSDIGPASPDPEMQVFAEGPSRVCSTTCLRAR